MTARRSGFGFAAAAIALSLVAATPASAFRPFDGTDATVAARHLFELEMSPLSYARMGDERALLTPVVGLNFGLGSGYEFTLAGASRMLMGPDPEGTSPALDNVEISLTKMLRTGVLQNRKGPSIATEEGIALPTGDQTHVGVEGSVILSQPLTGTRTMLHVTAELSRTQESRTGRFLSTILEGPEAWPVRPVAELSWEREGGDTATLGYLAGIIWQTRQGLTMDAALKALDGAEHGLELRTGFTWHIHVSAPK